MTDGTKSFHKEYLYLCSLIIWLRKILQYKVCIITNTDPKLSIGNNSCLQDIIKKNSHALHIVDSNCIKKFS